MFCQSCQLGKHVRLPFKLSNNNATFAFEIVHTDVWTSPVLSNTGFMYDVLFLDQLTHFYGFTLLNKNLKFLTNLSTFGLMSPITFNLRLNNFSVIREVSTKSPIS